MKRPTAKQKKATTIYLEHGGDLSVGEAMRMSDYSEKTADNPQLLTNSAGFKALAAQYGLNEINIIEPIKKGLNAKAQYFDKARGELVESDLPDNIAIPKYVNILAKLLGIGEFNVTKNESRSIKIEVKAKDTSENLIAGL